MNVYLALFIDGDNGLDNLDRFNDSEALLYANEIKVFDSKEFAINFLIQKNLPLIF